MRKMTGKEKAAVLLGFIPTQAAKEVMKHLSLSEVTEISKHMARLEIDTFTSVEDSVKQYVTFLKGSNSGLVKSGVQHVIDVLKGVVSDEELDVIVRNLYTDDRTPFEFLSSIKDPGPLMTLLANEEPQLIAVMMTNVKPSLAAEWLSSLPREKMRDVAEGIATMEQTNPAILARMEKYLSERLSGFNFQDASSETNGIKNIVSILNNVTRSTERVLFDSMEEKNPELAKKIKDNLFVFEDIVKLDNRSLQKVFTTITDSELIAKAMKNATVELQEKIISVLTEGRRKIIESELDGMGPIRKADSEEAQQKIANTVKELERKKEIVIIRGDGDVIL